MATKNDSTAVNGVHQTKRKRGAKGFPTLTFEETLSLGKIIQDHGVDGEMRRIRAFDRLGKSPDSGPSRQLVSTSSRYDLTSGSYQAEHLKLTGNGVKVFSPSSTAKERRRTEFELAIVQSNVFNRLYERLKDKRVPATDIMLDEVAELGVSPEDRLRCADIFLANIRYLGLVQNLSGVDRIISMDQALEGISESRIDNNVAQPARPAPESLPEPIPSRNEARPTVHIDIQIHIDAAASAEQIDQVFASMARHLYGKNSAE